MTNHNHDLDDYGTELPDSYIYSPRGASSQGRSSFPDPAHHQQVRKNAPLPTEPHRGYTTPSEDTRQQREPREPREPRQQRQPRQQAQQHRDTAFRNERIEKERRTPPMPKSSTVIDKRIKMFFGLLLMIVAILMAVFILSHFKNGGLDQSTVMSGAGTGNVSNIGGPVGAQTSYFFVTQWFGLGSFAFLVYFALVGLSLLGVKKTKFWATTFQCLLIGITTSIVLGLVTYSLPTSLSWGGEHGRFVNTFLIEKAGVPGAIALSVLLLGSIFIVYFNQISSFYKARKVVMEARRQRRQAAREEYERQRRAAEEALEKAKSELSEKESFDSKIAEEHNFAVERHESYTTSEKDETEATVNTVPVKTETASEKTVEQENTMTLDELEEMNEPAEIPVVQKTETTPVQMPISAEHPNIESLDQLHNTDVTEKYAINIDDDDEATSEIQIPEISSEEKLPAAENPVIMIDNEDEQDIPAIKEQKENTDVAISIDEQESIITDKDLSQTEAPEPSQSTAVNEEQTASLSPSDTPITLTVNEIEEVKQQSELYDPTAELSKYKRPPLELLAEDKLPSGANIDIEEQEENKQRIIKTLLEYGIPIVKIDATVGPTVTLFEIVPAEGVRIASIRRIEDDIARSLAAEGIRIIAPIPGKGTVGIEVPNHMKRTVTMRSVLSSRQFQESTYNLPVAMGTNVANEVFIEDLAKMPHLLVAGATGQGKSVGLNAIIASLIYKKHPAELKFVLVDPKMVEFSLYNKLERHFLAKLEGEEDAIITDPEKVKATLNSLCLEMDNRYRLLKDAYVRSLEEYNTKFINRKLNPEHGHKFLPYIVVVVDEFADLIMMAGKEIEMPIARIAQKARAVGIHLIIATQRPSTNVITGMIKANFPARIAFKVSAMVDSKTILDRTGANSLIGKGDMLFSLNSKLERVQCAFISTEEVEAVCDWIDGQVGYEGAYSLPEYVPDGGDSVSGNNFGDRDSLFDEAARFVVASGTPSTSSLQRRYSIGYNRAGKIMDQLEAANIVGPANGGKPRAVLVDSLTLERILENN